MTKHHCLLVIALVVLTQQANAQELLSSFKRFQLKNSGPENYVNALAKDEKGLLWLGTNKGLFRFNGRNSIEILIGNNSLDAPQVNDLAIQNNLLFVATQQGMQLFNLNTYTLLSENTISNIHEPVIAVLPDPVSGAWWLTATGNLYKWKNSKLQQKKLELGLLNRKKPLLFYKGSIWVTTQNKGSYCIDTAQLNITRHLTFPSLSTQDWTLRKNEQDALFLLSNTGLYKVNESAIGFEPQQVSDGNYFETFQMKNLKFSVVNTNNLVYHYELNNYRRNKTIYIGTTKPEIINNIIHDQQKIYIATTEGFVILDIQLNLFKNIHATYDVVNNSFEVPRGILETTNDYLLATYKGIHQYRKNDLNAHRFQKIDFNYALLKEKDEIWIGTDGKGLKKWNLKTGKITTLINGSIKKQANIKCLTAYNNSLLMGTDEAFFQFHPSSGICKEIVLQQKNSIEERKSIYQIKVLNHQQLLLATTAGLLLTDTNGRVYKNYSNRLTNKYGIKTYAFWVSSDQSIWAGTGNGVYHFSKTGELLHHFTTMNGLTGDRIASITSDNNQHLWVATFSGLSAINLKTFEINNFTKENGLPDNEFNHSSSFLASNGDLILGSMNGFVQFTPTAIALQTTLIPSLRISSFEMGNARKEKEIYAVPSKSIDTLQVEKQFNFVRINLFIDPLDILQKTEYEYKVVGIHPEWIKMGNNPIVYLDNYKKGTYHLQVRAITGAGSSKIITKSIVLVVDEYFYKTSFFYVLMGLTFFGMLLLYLLLYIRRNKKIAAVRQHIAEDLHDEVGSYLTGINMNIELMKRKNAALFENNYKTIETLGQKALLSLKDALWSLDNRSDNARDFWDRVKAMASETLDPLDIDFSFSEIPGLEKISLSLLEKNYLFFAIKECITNSIKYGDRKKVELSWEKSGWSHSIFIKNSIPKKAPIKTDGQGLKNIERRMRKIKGAVSVVQLENKFIVELKLNF